MRPSLPLRNHHLVSVLDIEALLPCVELGGGHPLDRVVFLWCQSNDLVRPDGDDATLRDFRCSFSRRSL
jgi:hypothetical protein